MKAAFLPVKLWTKLKHEEECNMTMVKVTAPTMHDDEDLAAAEDNAVSAAGQNVIAVIDI